MQRLVAFRAPAVVVCVLSAITGSVAVTLRAQRTDLRRVDVSASNSSCPCIGIRGIKGQVKVTEYDPAFEYPAEVGSYCNTWDASVNPHCPKGEEPGPDNDFCKQSWCFVDPCNCHIEQPPKVTGMFVETAFQAKPLYYSYATCGSTDVWTNKRNPNSCQSAYDEQACMDKNSGQCLWANYNGVDRCIGWDLAGDCLELPKESVFGQGDCPCVGFIGMTGNVSVEQDEVKATYPVSLGSMCKPWDLSSPLCEGEHCDRPWCFVDGGNCKLTDPPLMRPPYLKGATWQGRQLFQSYETCGAKRPDTTTTTTTATTTTTTITSTTTATTAAETTTAVAEEETTTEEGDAEEEELKKEDKEVLEETEQVARAEDRAEGSTSSTKQAKESTTLKPEAVTDDKDVAAALPDADADFVKDDDSSDNDDDGDDDEKDPQEQRKKESMYDNDAYEEDWHNEWEQGRFPKFRDLHPDVAARLEADS